MNVIWEVVLKGEQCGGVKRWGNLKWSFYFTLSSVLFRTSFKTTSETCCYLFLKLSKVMNWKNNIYFFVEIEQINNLFDCLIILNNGLDFCSILNTIFLIILNNGLDFYSILNTLCLVEYLELRYQDRLHFLLQIYK